MAKVNRPASISRVKSMIKKPAKTQAQTVLGKALAAAKPKKGRY
jgi:hypothetical protein